MAAAIASGDNWFGHRVKRAPVVYVALEGEAGFRLRVAAWETYNCRELSAQLFFLIHQPFKLTSYTDVTELAAVIPPGAVIIIDTLNRSAPTANENESRDMGLILEGSKRLQSLTGGLVVLIHHTGKDETRGMRGHSSLLAAMDAAIEVSRLNEQREWTVMKSKDGQDGQSFGFRLAIEELEIDEYGEPVTSCAIEPVGASQTRSGTPPPGKNQKTVLSVIQELLATQGTLGNPGVPPTSLSIPLELVITTSANQLPGEELFRKKGRVKEAIKGLAAQGVIKCNDVFLWL